MIEVKNKTPLELMIEEEIRRDDYYKSIDLGRQFRSSAVEITETLGGNEQDSICLYEFVESFYEAYIEFRRKYEELGILNLGENTTIGFRDYVESGDYKFFNVEILRNCLTYIGDKKATDITVPDGKYKYLAITERGNDVSGQFLGDLGADSCWDSVDLDQKELKKYLDLFGKYHKLFELSAYPGVVIRNEDVEVSFEFKCRLSSIEEISGVNVCFKCGECDMRISIDFDRRDPGYSYGYNAHYNGETVKKYIPRVLLDEMLYSIRISRSYLGNYKGVAKKSLIKHNLDI